MLWTVMRPNRFHTERGLFWGMGTFWVMNGLYQIFIPMPLPKMMIILRWVLSGFAFLMALSYLLPLRDLFIKRRGES